MYLNFYYVVENKNGDFCVIDIVLFVVVVVDSEGGFKFIYIGNLFVDGRFDLYGIVVDSLFNLVIVDWIIC